MVNNMQNSLLPASYECHRGADLAARRADQGQDDVYEPRGGRGLRQLLRPDRGGQHPAVRGEGAEGAAGESQEEAGV